MNRLLCLFAVVTSGLVLWLAGQGRQNEWVTADGCSWRVRADGHGAPTVVFEAGAGAPLETWAWVQPAVSRFAATFSYDRAGLGLSEPGAWPRDGLTIATELRAALQAAGAHPPFLLVGHSLGGPFIRVFAGLYPEDVAGLVLVDPTQEELVQWARERRQRPETEHPFRMGDEVDCAPLTFTQAGDSRIPHVPVVLISGMGPREIPSFLPAKLKEDVQRDRESLYPEKLKFHQRWVEARPGGRLVVTRNSGHGIPIEEPELVVDTIREAVRRGQR